ncbi:MAG TPA: ABC transporter permease [Spirochaetota bacterium]|nr:ABC transporter permease [Spirochaetota bacterium]HPC39554.1 ABC transporter permease [Spirochaetota bacterium]HPL15273.1 ABC transporter permease [Spirochaetota bacterium]HQF06891.1 ABC transporter permease [Spirochaetota bacterium]HQH95490.1 ABC transporter permease [Spirochaetota bacterium]
MKAFGSLMRMTAIADKEWIQIRRDGRSLFLTLFIPTLLVLLFGYALVFDVKNVKVAVYDQDRSYISRQYLERFKHTEYISIVQYVDNYKDIDRLINTGRIAMAVVIPPSFERKFNSGKYADIQVLVDGSDSMSALIATGYVKAISYEFNRDYLARGLRKKGLTSLKQPVEIKNRIWYNSELKSRNFIIPGNLGLILAIISALITSLTISREWERGTMETLITTPVRGYEVVLGKLVPYIFIGIFDVVCALVIGYFVFNVPFRGSFIELILISILFLVGTSGLGILISSLTRVQVLSVQVAIVVTYLPSFMLSDFIFPIKNMPVIIQAITYIIPAKYMIVVLKGIILRGVGYPVLITQIIFLSIFCILVLALCVKKFRVSLPDK